MEIVLKVSLEEANVIVNALANMPYGSVHELMPKLEGQFKQQMNPVEPVMAVIVE